MRIIVDGDACPGISIIENIAKKYNIELILYCDINHYINLNYGEVRVVDSGFQSVDMKIANECKSGDIVISQDYGVAAMALGKGALAISPRGYIYDNDNIDRLLFERHLSQKNRRAGGKSKGNHKRNKEDDDRLYYNLEVLIEKVKAISN